MPNNRWVATYEGILAMVVFGALAAENIARSVRGINVLTDIWYYFTYQSAAVIFIALLASTYSYWKGKNWKWLDGLRGAATLYSVITGVVFALLVNDASPAYMINHHILHQAVPVAMVAGWLMHQPSSQLTFGRTFKWLYYPWVYAAFALVVGALTEVYPYDFLDPTSGGYVPVLMIVAGLTLFAMFVSWVLVWLVPRVTHWSRMYMWARVGM